MTPSLCTCYPLFHYIFVYPLLTTSTQQQLLQLLYGSLGAFCIQLCNIVTSLNLKLENEVTLLCGISHQNYIGSCLFLHIKILHCCYGLFVLCNCTACMKITHISCILLQNVTLLELMDEDDIVQECKSQNRKLVDLLVF